MHVTQVATLSLNVTFISWYIHNDTLKVHSLQCQTRRHLWTAKWYT